MKKPPRIIIKNAMILICYVDDLVIFSEKSSSIECQKMELTKNFNVKDLQKTVQYLDIELDWVSNRAVGFLQSRHISS